MNKLKSTSLNTNIAAFKSTNSNSSSTTTTTKQFTSTNQAIVSISVNQSTASLGSSLCMASSFDNQCSLASVNKQQSSNLLQPKKKRAALENISNSNGSQQNILNLNDPIQQHQQHQPTKSDSLINSKSSQNQNAKTTDLAHSNSFKKSRVAFGSTTTTTTNCTNVKKADSLKKQNVKANSKENLDQIASKKVVSVKKATSLVNTNAKPQAKEENNLEMQLASTSLSSSEQEMTTTKSEATVVVDAAVEQKVADLITAENIQGWEDIDANDEHDEFTASDYVKQIFKYYRQREDKFLVNDYLKNQPHINKQMRLLLVDWMVEVQQQLEFNHEVLYLSVKLLDLYLNQRRIEKEKLQLLGGAAMFIACKFEERMPPIIEDFIFVSDNAYDRKELIKMEIDILKTVKFDIGIPLSYTFLRRYSKCIRADMKFLTLARYILELSLQDYSFAYVKDSLKACAALYLALRMSVQHEKNVCSMETGQEHHTPIISTANLTSTEWNATLIHFTGSFLKDFIHLIPQMNMLIRTAANSKYKTIFKKYSHQVFYEVAKIAPLTDAELDLLVQQNN